MNAKLALTKPTLVLLYGFPGAGKTHFARQLTEHIHAAHVQSDRIRFELFEQPRFDRQENEIVSHLMNYMTEEFLRAGISVVYDMNAARLSERRALRDMARKLKAHPVLIWFQIDTESAFARARQRDRRKSDDKYAAPIDRTTFETMASRMQNPTTTEDYIVVSGKHNFQTQRSAVIKKLYDMGLLSTDLATKVVKPGLVNLVPSPVAGRVDNSRRNIVIR
jgi:predicted kinase